MLKNTQFDIINSQQRIWVIIGGMFGAIFGSRILGFLEHPELIDFAKNNIIYIFASKTIVGGLLGGVIGVEMVKKHLGITVATGDLFCFPIILGMMIGRIACFMAGVNDHTWGNETAFVFGMDGGDGLYRHPVPLYEIVVLTVIWLSLLLIKNTISLRNGALFKLFMLLYLCWLFGLKQSNLFI